MQISAILSDYDGTLSPIINLNSSGKTNILTNHRTQTDLDNVLWEISSKRIITVVSTKDFNLMFTNEQKQKILDYHKDKVIVI